MNRSPSPFLSLLFAVTVWAGSGLALSSASADPLEKGPAPLWTLPDLNGKPVRLADYKGKVVILDFWATWCPPCRAEIPGFIDLQKKYGARGLVVIGASVDQDGPAGVKAFAAQNHMNYPVVMADPKVTDAYGGIEGIPTTFVIDPSGAIVKSYVGATEEGEFEARIQPLLAKVAAAAKSP